ncbi:aminoimidazole ribonucleotide synthetase [Capsaspora owczarzaki ATCC 30864]|uniref:aminoimidazole ribonucleotide synthetase n=1 Tax=Capsaspora owczarzaki (strain ATCC 30864) TaxID=595528 RepID=UPI0003520C30|nr:aminoimidazole ribonucleotide synthetase [Capsaspora owczarzaki ATCC 30864]|eukprot:XP_004365205.2 aminoimidazole ribonucleotide synthetase [Capsaspora owczarzaki ATCC 30864]
MSSSSSLTVLVLGSGGREHALAHTLARSARVAHVYVAPGNGGTASGNTRISNLAVPDNDFPRLIAAAREHNVNFVVVGPEQPLVDGAVEAFRAAGIRAFGPSARAARLEASKAYSKAFMKRHNIPTAAFETFTDVAAAEAYIRSVKHDVVIKASGLAAGKGVVLPTTKDEAIASVRQMMVDNIFGAAGAEVVIEERMTGPEASVFALTDGYSFTLLPAIQDHKRIFDNDEGPNTGGMGAFSPLPFLTPALLDTISRKIIKPTIDGMRREGSPYVGLLYAGVMLTPEGPKTLEYNCRFGDPETQAVLSLIDPSHGVDLIDLFEACVDGHLDSVQLSIKAGSAVTIVVASKGYPGAYEKGLPISLPAPEAMPADVHIFHAGTQQSAGKLVTSGGRVLAVTAVAPTLHEALARAYTVVDQVKFEGKQHRTDIAKKFAVPHTADAKAAVSYADAGVDIAAGDELVERIKSKCKTTRRPGCDAELGGFGGLFDLKPLGLTDPIMVSSTDGVGTKLRVAQTINLHDTVGIDLVAMCVNDLIVQGAEPLFFLDYFATGKLDVDIAELVVEGIAEGCRQAGCGLIGGETAEMPSMYAPGHYDLAGFTVGAVNRDALLPAADLGAGDVLIAIASSGLHSNGFSLVRHLVSLAGADYAAPCPFDYSLSMATDPRSCYSYGRRLAALGRPATLGEVLLAPTRMYIKCLLPSIRRRAIKALANITGGGFVENVPRVYSDKLQAVADAHKWPLPPVFKWLQQIGNVDLEELARTFNCGVGMVLIVDPAKVDSVLADLELQGEKAWVVGHLQERPAGGAPATIANINAWKSA